MSKDESVVPREIPPEKANIEDLRDRIERALRVCEEDGGDCAAAVSDILNGLV